MTVEEFKSSGNGMSYKIQVVEDHSIDVRHISKFPADIASKTGLDVKSKIHRVEVHGFIAAYAQVSRGEESYYLLGMIDPDSHTHFYIMVSYDDFDDVEMEEALEILLSVRST